MGLTCDIKKAIFQEGFFGSLTCRLNQGQLESKGLFLSIYSFQSGLDEFNSALYYKLLDQLMGKDQVPLDEPENPLHPCWTDIFDSQTAFDSAVDHFHEWYEHMSNKIRNLHQKETETRIRFTGMQYPLFPNPFEYSKLGQFR